ncbi:MAG TPA: hypothetical protein VN200_02710 [Rhodoglobus sp.]|nr:hypothetical protein [Rhodoglobus sp.]
MAAVDPDDDDAAFRWAGDDDRIGATPAAAPVAEAPAAAPTRPAQTPSSLLVTYGVLAGVFLIFTIGWVVAVFRSGAPAADLLGEIMAQFGEFLAIASPALWFVTVFALTRGRRTLVRLVLLLLGLIVVAPWPFLLGV